jgi:hypothetical protein
MELVICSFFAEMMTIVFCHTVHATHQSHSSLIPESCIITIASAIMPGREKVLGKRQHDVIN